MCPEAARLRRNWYKASVQLRGSQALSAEDSLEIMINREREDYKAALKALREHHKNCEVCRKENTKC